MKFAGLAARFAFYASVLTHALLVLYVSRHDLRSFWHYLPPLSRSSGFSMQVVAKVDAQREERVESPVEPPPRDRIGEESGQGPGSHRSDGPDFQHALKGPQDQAWLSRDPVGPGGLITGEASLPSSIGGLSSDPGSFSAGPIGVAPAGELVEPVVAPPPRLVRMIARAAPEPIAPGPGDDRAPDTQPVTAATTQPVEMLDAVEAGMHVAEVAAPSPQQPSAGRGRFPSGSVADPAPESDSESDPFSRIGSARFRNGKLDVRLGRKVKTVKPRFTIKGGLDQVSVVNPVTVVRVTIAPTGKVTDVRILRSSGSNEIDLPWVLAVYGWWFEPAKDEAGNPTTDVVQLSLGLIERAF